MLKDTRYKLRLIIDDVLPPSFNMALDEAILVCHNNQDIITLRFYKWNPYTFSFGYFQKPEKILKLQELDLHNIGAVRRMTGGKMVFHADEITFSIVSSLNLVDSFFSKKSPLHADSTSNLITFIDRFKTLLVPIVSFFKQKQLNVSFYEMSVQNLNFTRDKFKTANVQSGKLENIHCYQSAVGHSIFLDGKKFIGAAGVIKNNKMLIHGSIPIKFCKPPDSVWKEVGYAKFYHANSIASISDYNSVPCDYRLAYSIADVFCEIYDLQCSKENISKEELIMALELSNNKYNNLFWNESK